LIMRRVVITGIGIYSCIGTNKEEVAASLKAGRSGIGIDPARIAYGYRSPLTGIVPKPQLKGVLDRKSRMYLAEQGEYAYMSSVEAFADAKIDSNYLEHNDVGVIFGNDSCAKATIESNDITREKKDTTLIGSTAVFQAMNSTVTMNLSTIFKLKGINMTISSACSSGSNAIGFGAMLIRNGLQNMVLCGGAQETNVFSMISFDGISTFSTRVDEPSKASRPFDKDRDGLVPSGGAASLVLEEYEHAITRGATIYGEIVGFGFSSNGSTISQPNRDGSVKSILMALKDAGLKPNDIDYINAHATSTFQGDLIEAQALIDVFGEHKTPISSTKSMTGHECWMAGASEIVYSLLMMRDSFIAPNINYKEGDEYSKLLNIIPVTTEKKINTFLSNSFGFGGTNSTLIIKKNFD